MKRKILYTLLTIAVSTTAFFIGKNFSTTLTQSQTVQAEETQIAPELLEMTVENGGLYLEYTDGESFYSYWIPTENLERAGLINTANIIDWNTNGQELAVMTENDYEYYAYKSAEIYQNRNFVPVEK